MYLIIMGPPGAGKGSQAPLIKNSYGAVHISTGDMFREAIKLGTPLGKLAKGYIEKGELVPDSVTVNMVKERIGQPDCQTGFLLDGFPRTIAQAEALDAVLKERNIKLDAAIEIAADDEVLIRRISGRRICKNCGATYHIKNIPPKVEGVCDVCGGPLYQRKDDDPETVKNRLAVYYAQTKPLLEYYERAGLLVSVSGADTVGDTFKLIQERLGGTKIHDHH